MKRALAVQHIQDWRTSEAYFAIVRGADIVRRLNTSSWREARAALRLYKRDGGR